MKIFLSKDDPTQVGAGTYRFLAWFMDLDVLVRYTAETDGDGLVVRDTTVHQFNEETRSGMGRRVGSIVEKKDVPAIVVERAIDFWVRFG